jgi:hypothetical protein
MAGQDRRYQQDLLILSRRTRPGWLLEEGGKRNVEVGATSSCLGVRGLVTEPLDGALFARNLIVWDSSSHHPCRTTFVLVSRLRTVKPGCFRCWRCLLLAPPPLVLVALLPSQYQSRSAILCSSNPSPRPRGAGSAPCYPRAPHA